MTEEQLADLQEVLFDADQAYDRYRLDQLTARDFAWEIQNVARKLSQMVAHIGQNDRSYFSDGSGEEEEDDEYWVQEPDDEA